MIMFEQSRRLSEPLQWGRREKSIAAVLLGCVVAAAIALAVYALTSSAPSRKGCIEITFASTLGAARLEQCGARARSTCAAPAGYRGVAAQELREACRRAGYPLGAF
jgi:hypothetical protein